MQQVGTWLSLVERTLGVGEVASSNLVVPTISPFPTSRASVSAVDPGALPNLGCAGIDPTGPTHPASVPQIAPSVP